MGTKVIKSERGRQERGQNDAMLDALDPLLLALKMEREGHKPGMQTDCRGKEANSPLEMLCQFAQVAITKPHNPGAPFSRLEGQQQAVAGPETSLHALQKAPLLCPLWAHAFLGSLCVIFLLLIRTPLGLD